MRAFGKLTACLALFASLLIVSASPAGADETVEPLPDDFLWGVASSGFQSEGDAPDSNWLRYTENGDKHEPYGNGVDFRHRYAEDIALAADMGVEVYRFGIEWARVEPAPGQWDEAELAYYDDVVQHILDAGMTPMITLNHWVHPGWVADQGGWKSADTLTDFTAYSERIVDRYSGLGVMWVTFNEPTLYVFHEIDNGSATWFDALALFDRLAAAHGNAYDLIHELDPGAMVTSNVAFIPATPWLFDAVFLDKIASKLDFVGVDYYYGLSLDNLTAIREVTGGQASAQPDGIYYALRYYHNKFPDKPLYIVENGMPTEDGAPREDGLTRSEHLSDHVYWLQRAVADGMNVIGYNYWSITDNYEWGSYTPRFGLYTVDAVNDPDLVRHPTDAVPTYTDLIESGGVPEDYEPVVPQSICSLIDPPLSCLVPA
ncbi:glycoside hydrolase family 1 protein [Glycomyces buryatensis]|uniref:Glycoside hydrolase family 1 protein n=1 Tax=Glycomyces buryatensis TaxID=2570927 RepID=A0A4S8QJV5_9ACTN|nr:family 1 glycosylhydrolase [Glycomyces buryatensis]THV41689.1 glycoside hydrolase family 1 protein [Glycomyces buryatensis]